MNKKMYYTDPLKAAYMAREFGVEILVNGKELVAGSSNIISMYSDDGFFLFQGDKMYIHPDSMSIFEPQEGDITMYFFRDSGWCFDNTSSSHSWPKEGAINHKIIMRDNKHFFMPEVEDDKE